MTTAAATSPVLELWFPKTEDNVKLSHEYGVRPLIKGETVKYKLIDSDQDDRTRTQVESESLIDTGKHMKCTPGYVMVGKKKFFDSIKGVSVFILNGISTGTIKFPGGGEVKTSRPQSIKFLSDKPVVEVKWNEPEKYAFMERASENIDNPFRDPGVKARYYRVDPRKKEDKIEEKNAFEYTAIKWVREEAKFEQLLECAVYMNTVRPALKLKTDYKNSEASMAFSILKRELFELAKTDPKNILKGSNKIEAHMEMQVRDAERLQLILFTDGKTIKAPSKDRNQYWFHNDLELTEICPVGLGKNKHEALLEFFAKDEKGEVHYKKIMASLEKMLNPR